MPHHSSAIQPDRPSQTGFTLIEVLVVLIIVGMTSGVLFQALERAYRLQDRFGTELFNVQQGQMAADWYRQTVQGLYPDYPDGRNVFQGNEREFSGLTGNPLSDEYGAPTPVTWKTRTNQQNGTTELVYLEGKQETPILTWRGNQARFIYLDEQQIPYDSWPPPLGLSTQLPKQIQLVVKDAGEIIDIVASPMGPATPLPRLRNDL
jgi:general secretion pathway protein J